MEFHHENCPTELYSFVHRLLGIRSTFKLDFRPGRNENELIDCAMLRSNSEKSINFSFPFLFAFLSQSNEFTVEAERASSHYRLISSSCRLPSIRALSSNIHRSSVAVYLTIAAPHNEIWWTVFLPFEFLICGFVREWRADAVSRSQSP